MHRYKLGRCPPQTRGTTGRRYTSHTRTYSAMAHNMIMYSASARQFGEMVKYPEYRYRRRCTSGLWTFPALSCYFPSLIFSILCASQRCSQALLIFWMTKESHSWMSWVQFGGKYLISVRTRSKAWRNSWVSFWPLQLSTSSTRLRLFCKGLNTFR